MATKAKTKELPLNPKPLKIGFEEFFADHFIPGMGWELPILDIHRDCCRQLEEAFFAEKLNADGTRVEFYVINMPPRIGKTIIMCAFVVWAMTWNPKSQWIYASYAQLVANKQCRLMQQIIESLWFQKKFNVRFGDMQTHGQFTTSDGGCVYAAGNDSAMIGFGAGAKKKYGGCIILDDPQPPNEAMNPVLNEQLHTWFNGTCMSRRNSDEFTPIIIVQQRLNVSDLSGYVLKTYPKNTVHICYPALVETGPHDELNLEQGWKSTIPGSMNVRSLIQKRETAPYEFSSMYQQAPVMSGGNMIPIKKLQRYKASDMVEEMDTELKVITCDTAFLIKQENDYSVLMCWVKIGSKAYLVDMRRGKWLSPQLTQLMGAFFMQHNKIGKPVRKIVIEEALCGLGYLQALQYAGLPAEGIKRHKDKTARVMDILTYIYNEQVYLPTDDDGKDLPWVTELLEELAVFDHGNKHPHDDQVDAFADGISQCLARQLTSFDTMGPTRGPNVSRPVLGFQDGQMAVR